MEVEGEPVPEAEGGEEEAAGGQAEDTLGPAHQLPPVQAHLYCKFAKTSYTAFTLK
jgi:hypothetical protein